MGTIKVTEKEYKVIRRDLDRAKKYLRLLELEKQSPRMPSTREALTVAAIVAYSRPFTACTRVNEKKRRPWISATVAKNLPPDLRAIHDDLVEQRHSIWAHTDESHFDERPLIKSYPKAVIPEFLRLIDQVLGGIAVSGTGD